VVGLVVFAWRTRLPEESSRRIARRERTVLGLRKERLTMPDKFVLKIDLWNDAMQTPAAVALALRSIAAKLQQYGDSEFPESGAIMDANGNKVGKWEVK